MVLPVGWRMSMSRLWVRISNCSRDFRSMCGLRRTVYRSMRVGSGIGPCTVAPVRCAVSTISWAVRSRTSWSYASMRMRMRSLAKPATNPPHVGNPTEKSCRKYQSSRESAECQEGISPLSRFASALAKVRVMCLLDAFCVQELSLSQEGYHMSDRETIRKTIVELVEADTGQQCPALEDGTR